MTGVQTCALPISINRGEDADKVKEFVEKYKKNWPVLLDRDMKVYSKFISKGVPAFVIIDSRGRLAYRQVGWADELINDFDDEIKELLAN